MTCAAKIRPFRPVNDTEISCEVEGDHGHFHVGTINDYAYPGSQTILKWAVDDRRAFHGDFQPCEDQVGCILPHDHRDDHVF